MMSTHNFSKYAGINCKLRVQLSLLRSCVSRENRESTTTICQPYSRADLSHPCTTTRYFRRMRCRISSDDKRLANNIAFSNISNKTSSSTQQQFIPGEQAAGTEDATELLLYIHSFQRSRCGQRPASNTYQYTNHFSCLNGYGLADTLKQVITKTFTMAPGVAHQTRQSKSPHKCSYCTSRTPRGHATPRRCREASHTTPMMRRLETVER